MKHPSFVIGNVVKGDDFWGRDAEVKEIWNALKKGSVLLKAPRRFGKTSIMVNLYENPDSGYKVIFLDTECLHDPQDFIATLMTELFQKKDFKNKVVNFIKGYIPAIEEVGIGVNDIADVRVKIRESIKRDWKEIGSDFVSKLIETGEKKIVLILDELPMMLQNIERRDGPGMAREFLEWFRSIRQQPKLSHIRWVVGGSIGIEHILNKIGVGTKSVNDLTIISIDAFPEKVAKTYIKALLKGEGITRAPSVVTKEIIDVIGAPVPFFIQLLLKESLYRMRKDGKKMLNKEIIRTAYKDGVLGPASRTYFEHYFTRLKEYYGDKKERIAKRLILEVARKKKVGRKELYKLFRQESMGELEMEFFSYVMSDIENDFYVSYNEGDESYTFKTNVLRDWWLRNYDLVEESL